MGQNIAAAAILLQALREPYDPAQRDLQHKVRHLVELAAVPKAESSSLLRRQAASCPASGQEHPRRDLSAMQQAPPGTLLPMVHRPRRPHQVCFR